MYTYVPSLSRPDALPILFCPLAELAVLCTVIGFVLGPFVVGLIKRDDMPFVDDQGKEALNFNITVFIVCVSLCVFALVTLGLGLVVVVPLWIVIGLVWLIVTIVAAIKANEGEYYRYHFALRLIR